MTDNTHEKICLEFFDPTIDGQTHLGIQTTLHTGEEYWMAFTPAGMAEYLTVLLEQTIDMGPQFCKAALHALKQFMEQQIAALEENDSQ